MRRSGWKLIVDNSGEDLVVELNSRVFKEYVFFKWIGINKGLEGILTNK